MRTWRSHEPSISMSCCSNNSVNASSNAPLLPFVASASTVARAGQQEQPGSNCIENGGVHQGSVGTVIEASASTTEPTCQQTSKSCIYGLRLHLWFCRSVYRREVQSTGRSEAMDCVRNHRLAVESTASSTIHGLEGDHSGGGTKGFCHCHDGSTRRP